MRKHRLIPILTTVTLVLMVLDAIAPQDGSIILYLIDWEFVRM